MQTVSEDIFTNFDAIDRILKESGDRYATIAPEFQRVILMAARIAQASGEGRPSWHDTYMLSAAVWALRSKDKHTKVGCAVSGPDNEPVTAGYNNFPRDLDDSIAERYERPLKYCFTGHSERNAYSNANRRGAGPLKGCKLYVLGIPCNDCCIDTINSGITEVYVCKETQDNWFTEKYADAFARSILMFKECGVKVFWWKPGRVWPHEAFEG